MTDEQIQKLTDMNYRVLHLLGYATYIVSSYQKLEAYHDDSASCEWFFKALNAVVYENKPLPEMQK